QVFADRKVLIEAEPLRHVTDVALDFVGLRADVQSEARALALIRRQQPREHADGRSLAGAIGAEKAVDGATLDLHGKVAHDLAPLEGLGEALHVDRYVGRHHRHRAAPCEVGDEESETVTGWPTRNF